MQCSAATWRDSRTETGNWKAPVRSCSSSQHPGGHLPYRCVAISKQPSTLSASLYSPFNVHDWINLSIYPKTLVFFFFKYTDLKPTQKKTDLSFSSGLVLEFTNTQYTIVQMYVWFKVLVQHPPFAVPYLFYVLPFFSFILFIYYFSSPSGS